MYINLEQIGVHKASTIILEDFKWIFREQPISDFGIDAHIEIVEESKPTGKLLGLQIKSGDSYFKYSYDEGFYFYGDKKHLEYWLNHSLPVILIIYNPSEDKCYWQHIKYQNISETDSGWKTFIKYSQIFDKKAKEYIYNLLLRESDEVIRFKQLIFNIDLIEYLENGNRIYIYTEDYINKSYKRGITKIILINDKENETVEKEWFGFHGPVDIEDIIYFYFPWADFEIDYDFYSENFDEENVKSMFGIINYNEIYPYDILTGEVACYRFRLGINSLGKSFLNVMSYIYSK